MSQLAFNIHGERFEAPADIVFWRVRRLKPGGRGTPEVVFGNDGLPLLISSEADVEEFRRVVGNAPGRYRLDAVNEDQRGCENAVPSYLQLRGEVADESAPAAPSSGHDELLRMVVAANTEMARCIAEKFAGVMDSAATLLRAADGAGMPQRDVQVIDVAEVRNAPSMPIEETDAAAGELSAILRSALDQVMPLVGHTINTRVLGLSNEQSLALLGTGAATPAEPEAPSVTHPPFSDDVDTSPHIELPPKDLIAHMFAIEKELDATEVALVRKAVGQMKPDTLTAWREKLAVLTPKEAAEMVRRQVRKGVPS